MGPMATARHTAEDIEVLDWRAAVRRRPAMYVGSTDARALEHMMLEVVSNSIDEHISNADRVSVSFDEAVIVEDNGRGIPLDVLPRYGRSALEVVLTQLHPGHGAGLAIANALSERFEVEVHRDGGHHRIALSRGLVTEPFHRVGPSNRTGTLIRYRADPEIFGSARLDSAAVLKRLKTLSWLTPHLTWTVQGRTTRSAGLTDCLVEETGGALLPGSLVRVRVSGSTEGAEPSSDLRQHGWADRSSRRGHRALAERLRSAHLRVPQLRDPDRGLTRRGRSRGRRTRVSGKDEHARSSRRGRHSSRSASPGVRGANPRGPLRS
ncbi:MAG: hypothetical protein JNM69_32665 [Archangium sp.]|nr:hypothetical protein [Archangium sp.]